MCAVYSSLGKCDLNLNLEMEIEIVGSMEQAKLNSSAGPKKSPDRE